MREQFFLSPSGFGGTPEKRTRGSWRSVNNFTKVFVRYCDGGYFSGDVAAPVPVPGRYFWEGARPPPASHATGAGRKAGGKVPEKCVAVG